MTQWLTAALLAVVAGGPALALSCMPADPARTFQRAEADAAVYSVLLGTLDFAPLDRPRGAFAPGADDQARSARFSGQALGNSGFAPASTARSASPSPARVTGAAPSIPAPAFWPLPGTGPGA